MNPKNNQTTYHGWPWLILAIFVAFFNPASLWAQQATGKIVGTVTDAQGGVMPNVKVTATNQATHVRTSSVANREGFYQIINLPIGEYRITAEEENFKVLETDAPPLQINQVLRVDLQMEVGTRTQTVTDRKSVV